MLTTGYWTRFWLTFLFLSLTLIVTLSAHIGYYAFIITALSWPLWSFIASFIVGSPRPASKQPTEKPSPLHRSVSPKDELNESVDYSLFDFDEEEFDDTDAEEGKDRSVKNDRSSNTNTATVNSTPNEVASDTVTDIDGLIRKYGGPHVKKPDQEDT